MSGITYIGLVICVVFALVNHAEAATHMAVFQPEQVHGKLVYFCEYKGIRLLAKSKLKDYDDCQMCTCNKGGELNCADLVGDIRWDEPSDCIPVRVGCKNRWVLKTDPERKCPKKRIPSHSAVGK